MTPADLLAIGAEDAPRDITERIYMALANRMAFGLDEALSIEISKRVGHCRWRPSDMIGRLSCVTTQEDRRTTWLLDEQPILVTWPITTQSDGRSVSASQMMGRPG